MNSELKSNDSEFYLVRFFFDKKRNSPPLVADIAPPNTATAGLLKRDEWMQPMSDRADSGANPGQSSDPFDYFSGMGNERKRRRKEDKPDPEKVLLSFTSVVGGADY